MRKRLVAASAALIIGPLSAAVYAAIPVEQIEAYGNPQPANPYNTEYTPVNFAGNPTITLGVGDQGGVFPNITFQALTNTSTGYNGTYYDHAYAVGNNFYGAGSVAYQYVTNPSVTDVYCSGYDTFLGTQLNTQANPGLGGLPSDFPTGVKVVNNSYASGFNISGANTDAYRRIDYLINKDNVTFVAGAVSSDSSGNTYVLDWSSFNCIAVSGSTQSFNPALGTGKQHADLYSQGDASFATAFVSSDATALYGYAQGVGAADADAMQNVVNKSLLMSGADKFVNGVSYYTRETANNLDTLRGAGQANYSTSLAILQAGEKSLLTVSGGSATGTPSGTVGGWSYGTIAANGESVVLFNASSAITNFTASLNWNVTSPTTGGDINTSVVYFPNLTFQLVPVTAMGNGKYALGANQSNPALFSRVTGDNVQCLYDTDPITSGIYALEIGGDSSLSAAVGLSYTFSYTNQWNSSSGGSWSNAGNWSMSIPDAQAARANFFSSPGLTASGVITLNGNQTVGELNFNNTNTYNISSGTGGTLTIDDTNDIYGVNPQINVSSGSQIISAPVSMANGANITVASGASLTITGTFSGPQSGADYIIKYGPGTLIFSNTITAASLGLVGGTTTVSPTGVLNTGPTYINSGTTLNFAANSSGGILVRNVSVPLIVQAGGTLALAPSTLTTNRQLLIPTGGITLAGTTGAWTGKIDLANNDMDETGVALATVINQIEEGYNNGKWNGTGGILSTSAAANTSHLTALGVIQNNQSGTALFTASHPFDGTTPGIGDILIKYTYYGDANLSGSVDGSDYSLIDNGYLKHLTGWYNGDFNYDSVVNGSDYTLIDNAFNEQGTHLTSQIADPTARIAAQIADISAVPEPASSTMIAFAATAMLCRRRRLLIPMR